MQQDPFDVLNESVVRIDASGTIQGWNTASETLYGMSRANVVGTAFEDLGAESASWKDRLATDDLWSGEEVREAASGPTLVALRWAAQRDRHGKLLGLIETGRAAEELQHLRREVKENGYRYENLFRSLAVAFFETDFRRVGSELKRLRDSGVTDLKGYLLANPDYARRLMDIEEVLDVNAAAVKLFAASSPDDLRGSHSSRFWPDESIADYVGALMAVMEKKAQFVCETKMSALDGSLFDVLFTVAWSPESAKRGVMVVGVIDLGDRNRAYAALARSEAKYRNLFEAMSVGILEFDFSQADHLLDRYRAEGIVDLGRHLLDDPVRMLEMLDAVPISSINDRALHLFALERPQSTPDGIRWLFPPYAYPIVARAIQGRYAKQTMPQVETRLRRADGSEIDVTFTLWAEPERRPDQPVLCAITDITERIEARSRFDKLQAEFAHASRVSTLGELAASIAHEVSQPLAAIVINSEVSERLLAAGKADAPPIASMNARTLRAARRATDILARMRLAASPQTPVRQALLINDVISDALEFVTHELSQSAVTCTLELAPDLPAVLGDRIQLQQIVVNLVLNAAQALRGAGVEEPTIRIGTTARGGSVIMAVEDNGPGFPPDHVSQIFDSFYTTKASGMGMGLAVCRSIAEHHGGSIDAGSAPDGGARFVLRLPEIAVEEVRI